MNINVKRQNKYSKWKPFLVAACCLLFFAACNKADLYYEKLDRQPEIVRNLKIAYAVGDTLTLTGRLNPENGLDVYVGDIKSTYKVVPQKLGMGGAEDLDAVEIILTKEMGVGENRPVKFISAGISIDVGSIEIVGDANIAVLDKQLELIKVADIPQGAKIIYYRGKNGNNYLWNANTKKLIRIASNGGSTAVFDESQLTDENGTFTILEFNAGGISADERYFYFSAKVAEKNQPRSFEVYKIIRYDFQNGVLTTINRTEYSLSQSRRTPESVQPFEGNIKSVKIFKVTAVYPDNNGNIYFDLMSHFLTKMDNSNLYSYLLDLSYDFTSPSFIPQIFNAANNEYYSANQVHQFFPGKTVSGGGLSISRYFDVDAKQMYGPAKQLSLIDMETGFETGTYPNRSFESKDFTTPYVTASLNSFNGGLLFPGNNPLAVNKKLIGIYFQDQISNGNSYYDKFYNRFELPALCEIDFENNRVKRYSPKRLVLNKFNVKDNYKMINIDQDGMLYLTANEGKVIVKTAYVN